MMDRSNSDYHMSNTPPPPPPPLQGGASPVSPQSQSSPRSSTRKRSVSGALFTSFKTHLTVVRSAISSSARSPRGGGGHNDDDSDDIGSSGRTIDRSGGRPVVKDGELYTWDATQSSRRKNLSNGNLSMMGSSTSTPIISHRKRSRLEGELEQPMPPSIYLDENQGDNNGNAQTTSAGGVTYEMAGSNNNLPKQQQQNLSTSQEQRNFYLFKGSQQRMSSASAPSNLRRSKSSSQYNDTNWVVPKSLTNTSINTPMAVPTPMFNSWSWGEAFLSSQDDEDISVPSMEEEDEVSPNKSMDSSAARPVKSVNVKSSAMWGRGRVPPPPSPPPQYNNHDNENGDASDDDSATCTNTVIEKVRQRGKKASRASIVGAFVTFLKALFGIGMLSNPAVLGEVGLVLGTFCHLFIVVGCAFACYLLLAARQLAKMEVMTKQRRDAERREEYEMWKAEMEERAKQQRQQPNQGFSSPNSTANGVQDLLSSVLTPVMHNTDVDPVSEQEIEATNTSSSTLGVEEEFTVAPVPIALNRVSTANMMPPKQGWGRCKDAIDNATSRATASPRSGADSTITTSIYAYEATPSCGNVQVIRQPSSKRETPRRSRSKSNNVSDEYQRFSDKVHNSYMPSSPPARPPTPPPLDATPRVRLVTYGDVAKYLAGKKASFFIIFTIVTVHLMFASGMVHLAVENLCYVVGWERLGWSYTYVEEGEEGGDRRRLGPSGDEDDHRASRSSDEEEYYLEWKGPDFTGRLAMASLLFPIIHGLLQIPTLTELATISTFGLLTYAFGCVGSMMYTAVVLTDGHPFLDHPDDMWKTKWSGIPTYVATTIYCIEGINLALPTVTSIEGAQRWGGPGLMKRGCTQQVGISGTEGSKNESERRDLSVFIVVGAVFLYGMVTLVVSWIGLAGGLGGGIGTMHGEDGCWDVTYCLNSSTVRFVYMLSLGVALVLTLPVILYPSTEMLEVWLDERNDERRRRKEAAAMASQQEGSPRAWLRQKSVLPDDETVYTVSDTTSPKSGLGIQHDGIEMTEISYSTSAGDYAAPEVNKNGQPEPSPMAFYDNESLVTTPNAKGTENIKLKARRKLKYWKLRMFLALIICVIGTIEGSFPSVLKAAEVIRGVGLSIAGLIFPPLLYMSAVGGNFSVPMATAMALLIGLGLFNIVLVLMSAFGSVDYIVEEGRGNFYDL